MDKKGICYKNIYSNTKEDINMYITLRYNTYTGYIGLCTGFHKSSRSNNGLVNNRNCPAYLGVTVAEQLLGKVFKNVEMMPYGNKGFDFKCNQGYMIDVKSATKLKERDAWNFNIHQNPIADYFLCLAFDDRKNLNPMHIWLIPSKEINHLKGFLISENTIYKWNKYELTDKLDKVIGCCNIMKGSN